MAIPPKIAPRILKTSDWTILDVRTGMEHGEMRLACPHIHVPLDELHTDVVRAKCGFERPLAVLCRSGVRAAKAAGMLQDQGFTNVAVIDGGIINCQQSGEPMEGSAVSASCGSGCGACHSPISLERQVRIAAGLMVALGSFLSLIAHPAFALIPLCVGGGLIFAGMTDRCGLALFLTKAPWNRLQS